jgi:hypothetical protein
MLESRLAQNPLGLGSRLELECQIVKQAPALLDHSFNAGPNPLAYREDVSVRILEITSVATDLRGSHNFRYRLDAKGDQLAPRSFNVVYCKSYLVPRPIVLWIIRAPLLSRKRRCMPRSR